MVYKRLSPPIKINEFQGGFKKGHRCYHWTSLLHDVIQEKHSKLEELHVVAIDCEKAFESVSFDAMLDSVKGSGLKGIVRKLVCFQRLRIDGKNLWMYTDRGTPQESVLSPPLFNASI